MPQYAPSVYSLRPEQNPVVGRFAEQIRLASLSGPIEDRWRGLLEDVLEYAAEAEQRISAQSERIFYLENLAETDELTGLINRRGFNNALKRALANAARHGETGLVVYIDLDGFKGVNDGYGHAAGDAVLRAVARALKQSVRATDYAARLGGDEFGLLLTHADAEAVDDVVAKIRNTVTAAEAIYKGAPLKVGASIGSAVYGPQSDAADILRRADAQMYRDKHRSAAA
ncbi:MAG: GGDEF domain-containing protein [Pseudomonadota bacterium]